MQINIIKPPIWILVMMAGLSLFAETVYTPSLPQIAQSLNVLESIVEHTVTIYLLGFALGILFWGILSDKFGRKVSAICGLSIFILGCLICYLSRSIEVLMFGRLVQSFGGGFGSVLSQAISRDAFEGKDLTRVYFSTSIAMVFFPSIGPICGAFITKNFLWQDCFLFLMLFSLLVMVGIYFKLPETNLNKKKDNLSNFCNIFFRDKKIIALGFLVGTSLGISFSYFGEAPFFFINGLGIDRSTYGNTFAIVSIMAMISGIVSKKMSKNTNIVKMIFYGISITAIFAILFVVLVVVYNFLLFDVKLMAFMSVICRGMILFGQIMSMNAILSIAVVGYKNNIGAASSFFGFYYYLITFVFTFFMGYFHNGSLYTMPVYFMVLSSIIFSVFVFSRKFIK